MANRVIAISNTDAELTQDDAPDIVEELHEAQNHTFNLGFMLKLNITEVEAIHSRYQEPKERLLHIIVTFLRQTKTKPTWKVIVDALKTRFVNLQKLAEKLEAVHLPKTTRPTLADKTSSSEGEINKACEENETRPIKQTWKRDPQSHVKELQQQLQSRNKEIASLQSRCQELESTGQDSSTSSSDGEVKSKNKGCKEAGDGALAEAQQQLKQKEDQLQLCEMENQVIKEQLSKKERELAEAVYQLKQKEDQLLSKNSELLRAEETLREERQQIQEMRQRVTRIFQSALQQFQSESGNAVPCVLFGGSATTDGQVAYFVSFDSNQVYQYNWSIEKWDTLPSLPCMNSGLAIIDGELCAVGGSHTNQVFTLRWTKWVEEYPPMSIARSSPAVVSTSNGTCLIVIGGLVDDGGWTSTVELFQVNSQKWYRLTDLLQPLTRPSVTLCGDKLHVIGDHANGYFFSLQSLPSSDVPQLTPHLISWTCLPPLPVKSSTAATLCGQLIIIGGRSDRWPPVKSIYQLVDGQWVEIGSLACCRFRCLVASASPDKIMIVGGKGAQDTVEKIVELVIGRMEQAKLVVRLV